jgi:hypothetical protein
MVALERLGSLYISSGDDKDSTKFFREFIAELKKLAKKLEKTQIPANAEALGLLPRHS